MNRTANVIGLGLIGGSVASGLTERGWTVRGDDSDPAVVERALERGVIAAPDLDPDALVTVVAVPASDAVAAVGRALRETTGYVTDVVSVKGPICAVVDDPRFVGGHPMAGSELDGLDGADPDMFSGAVWVLTPRSDTDDRALSSVSQLVRELGAEAVALTPEWHDQVVAVVSHVPHLAAATLMQLAADRSEEHVALLRLAAGGFRDMTRIASGHPRIWLDICSENQAAITDTLDGLIDRLRGIRTLVASGDRAALEGMLTTAREARRNLPGRIANPEALVEFRIPIPDRTGSAAEVFTLAADLGVNIPSFEVVHLAEGNRGVAVVLVDATKSDLFRGGLLARGFKPAVTPLA